jgi:hypothetical protein
MSDEVKLTPGLISYTDGDGVKQRFYFQCNPTSLTRSRSASRTDTKATTPAGTSTERGEAGRKYTHRVSPWKLESIELWLDASMPYWSDQTNRKEEGSFEAVQRGLEHLRAISEPGPVRKENNHRTGAPPQPSPPLLTFTLGERSWIGHVSSLSIVEKEFTPDRLLPKQIKATLSLDIIETLQQLDQGKTGGEK